MHSTRPCCQILSAVIVALIAGRSAQAEPAADVAAATHLTGPTAALSGAYRATLRQSIGSLTSSGVPGVVVYARDGTRSLTLASGVRDIASRTPLRRGDRFRVG